MRYSGLMLLVLLAIRGQYANAQTDVQQQVVLLAQNKPQDGEIIPLKTLSYYASTVDTDLLQSGLVHVEPKRIATANSLGEALAHVSGIQSSAFGPNAGAPIIRSLSGHRVSILENGQSVNAMNAFSGNVNIPFEPLFSRSIAVNKSADVVRYGGAAIGGRVDIDTGLISRSLEHEDHRLDVVFKKGFNDFDAKGFKLNINNQKNFSTNVQYSNQHISSYKIPGNSKAAVCDTLIFPTGGGVNSALADACQRDARINQLFNKASPKYLNQYVLDDIAANPEHFYDYYDGLESLKYTDQASSQYFVNGRLETFHNPENPDYVEGSEKYRTEYIKRDVTPNYSKKLENSYMENKNLAIGSSYFFDQGYIGISLDHKQSDYGVPGFSMENKSFQSNYTDMLPVGVKIKQNKLTLESVIEQPLPFLEQLSFKASQLDNRSGEYLGRREANHYHFKQNAIELAIKHQPLQHLVGELGLNYALRDVRGTGPQRYLPNVKTENQAFFITEKLDFSRWSVDAGYRVEQLMHRVNDDTFQLARNASNRQLEDQKFDLNSYFIGGQVRVTDHWGLQLKYSYSQRAPEINELYASNPHYSIMTQEEGNQQLRKEVAKSLELSSSIDWRGTALRTTLYRMKFDDYLFLSHSGAAMANRLPLKYWQQTDTQIDGFEVDLSHQLALQGYGDLTFSVFADWVKNKATDPSVIRLANDGVYLPNMPTNRYGLSLEWQKDTWQARWSTVYYDKAEYLGKNVSSEVALPAYSLMDASLSKKMVLKNAVFDLFIQASNLLNQEARPHQSPLKYIAPLPGRAFQIGVQFTL
ncbi:TonB-dependent receptor [Acinetobacter larvae]|uniref:TonB-dependent receptor n=1 Tax=Acinetobacter larvae TaxID=1789224 RepID=A0A1B2LWU9_9GAMM|nr:TonB-dependent receptor [Acinetobacter larvae]AOA57420.1 TonB-dependent receptor [Acinetobacter larvae]